MAKTFSLQVVGNDDFQPIVSGASHRSFRQLATYFRSLIGGTRRGAVTVRCRNDATSASGTVTISSGSGSITATINGVAIAVTWGTSDTATATALAAAINASTNALVQYLVTATSALGVVTITSLVPGKPGNMITLAASGTGASASVTRLAGATETYITFTF